MIAQMQGKFQIKIMPMCGHLVHEDVRQYYISSLKPSQDPVQVATSLQGFAARFAKRIPIPGHSNLMKP